ncbi:MAG: T9SS type A sorting domain-containing protein [bacterium]|nr:T9SS type A sorting domain-containing protein [bacterium]
MTEITYDLARAGRVSLRVFDLLGREVAALKDGFSEAGSHRVTFDGRGLASGIYFARLDAGAFSQTKKLMLLR